MSSATGTKRSLPARVLKMRERKKRKLQGKMNDVQPMNGKVSNVVVPLKLDEMSWKEVELPDKMEDYEGFFGLEEIDDVDVVRDQKSGIVSFKTLDSKIPSKTALKPQTGEVAKVNEHLDDQFDNDEEWSGIEDDTVRPSTTETIGDLHGAKTRTEETKTGNKNKKKAKAQAQAQDHKAEKVVANGQPKLGSTSFELLDEDDGSADADVSAWHSLNLFPEILSGLSKMGFSRPTEIQSAAIPHALEGYDLIGKAPTGSGKTLAYGIPIVQEWLKRSRANVERKKKLSMQPSALIIAPTRELAHQITEHLQTLLSHVEHGEHVTAVSVTGGLSIHKQQRLIGQAQIVVGTPGRLWEVMSDGHGTLAAMKRIKFLVLDEADRLLSEGHFKELEEILSALDKETTTDESSTPTTVDASLPPISHIRQTLVFSATFSKTLHQRLSRRASLSTSAKHKDTMAYLLERINFRASGEDGKPRFVDVNPVAQMAANLREGLVECPVATDKDLYLYALLLYHHPGARALVFVNAVSAVRRLTPLLAHLGLAAHPLHSHMPQKARLRSVERFSSPAAAAPGTSQVLVATDVAARGLDIPAISLVLHYSVPRTADAYIHRSGRTARAAAAGSSILLCAPGEAAGVRRLVAQVHARAPGAAPALRQLAPAARLVAALRRHVLLAKRLADSQLQRTRANAQDELFRAAREELGSGSEASGPSSDDEAGARGRQKGTQDKRGRRREQVLSKAEAAHLRAELADLLKRKVNVGVSEKYLVGRGGAAVDELLRQRDKGVDAGTREVVRGSGSAAGFAGGMVLGSVPGLGWEDE